MITLIVGVLLLFFFIFVAYKCASTWGALHITFSVLTFLAAIGFLVSASNSLKTRLAWIEVHDTLKARLAAAQEEHLKLLDGDLSEITQTSSSVRSVQSALRRVTAARGRVWRNCERSNIEGDPNTGALRSVTLSTAPLDAAEGETQPNGIQENTVLYGFLEQESPEGLMIPAVFLGEFKATAGSTTSVTLAPTIPLDGDLLAKLRNSAGMWSLYERMPMDSHTVYQIGPPDEEHLFGPMPEAPPFEPVPEARVRQAFPNRVPGPDGQAQQWLPEDQYEDLIGRMMASQRELVDQYLRDGQPAEENDPPENVWVRVRFLKTHEVVVDAQLPGGGGDQITPLPLTTQYFDGSGQALLNGLRRGGSGAPENVVFAPNDEGIFVKPEADSLVASGIVDKIQEYYVRPLQDFAFAYHENFRVNMQLNQDIRTVMRNMATIKDADAKCQSEITIGQQQSQMLSEDLGHLKIEGLVVASYAEQLAAGYDQTMEQLSGLYRVNLILAEDYTNQQQTLADEINRLTAEAMNAP